MPFPTDSFQDCCIYQLCQSTVVLIVGIEPTLAEYKTATLPLSYISVCAVVVKFVYEKHETRHISHGHKALRLILHVTSPCKYCLTADS